MEYDRIRRRGLEKVTSEIMMVCLGYVVRKIFVLMDGNKNLDYWIAPPNIKPEEIKKPKIEKIINKSVKKKSIVNCKKHGLKQKIFTTTL